MSAVKPFITMQMPTDKYANVCSHFNGLSKQYMVSNSTVGTHAKHAFQCCIF